MASYAFESDWIDKKILINSDKFIPEDS